MFRSTRNVILAQVFGIKHITKIAFHKNCISVIIFNSDCIQ